MGEEPTNHDDFYDLNDPANQQLLEQIKTGLAPLEILKIKPGQKVSVKVAHEDTDWTEPPKKLKPFHGEGRTLGGVASSHVATTSMPGSFPESAAPPATSQLQITTDESKPITSLQVRLSDGTRLVARFNHTHTVQDLYSFVRAYVSMKRSDRSSFLTKKQLKKFTKLCFDDNFSLNGTQRHEGYPRGRQAAQRCRGTKDDLNEICTTLNLSSHIAHRCPSCRLCNAEVRSSRSLDNGDQFSPRPIILGFTCCRFRSGSKVGGSVAQACGPKLRHISRSTPKHIGFTYSTCSTS